MIKRFLTSIFLILLSVSVCFGLDTSISTNKENTWSVQQNFEGGALIGDPTQDGFVEFPWGNQALGSNGHLVGTYNEAHTQFIWYFRVDGVLVPVQIWNIPQIYEVSFSDGVLLSDAFVASTNTIAEVSFSDGVTLSDAFSATNVPAGCQSYSTDKCTGGVATAEAEVQGDADGAFANNGATTYWSTFTAAPKWIKYDFGSGVSWDITRVRIWPAVFQGSWCLDVKIEGSNNDSSWTTLVADSDNNMTDAQWYDIDFTNGTAYRYYRITVLSEGYTGGDGVSISEIEMLVCAD